jgi:hypothetical protein
MRDKRRLRRPHSWMGFVDSSPHCRSSLSERPSPRSLRHRRREVRGESPSCQRLRLSERLSPRPIVAMEKSRPRMRDKRRLRRPHSWMGFVDGSPHCRSDPRRDPCVIEDERFGAKAPPAGKSIDVGAASAATLASSKTGGWELPERLPPQPLHPRRRRFGAKGLPTGRWRIARRIRRH